MMTAAPAFGDTETIKVRDLRRGDWVQSYPAQHRIRGCEVGSGVKTIETSHRWYTQSRPRGPRMALDARRVTFLMSATVLDVPADSDIIVRRMITDPR